MDKFLVAAAFSAALLVSPAHAQRGAPQDPELARYEANIDFYLTNIRIGSPVVRAESCEALAIARDWYRWGDLPYSLRDRVRNTLARCYPERYARR